MRFSALLIIYFGRFPHTVCPGPAVQVQQPGERPQGAAEMEFNNARSFVAPSAADDKDLNPIADDVRQFHPLPCLQQAQAGLLLQVLLCCNDLHHIVRFAFVSQAFPC